MSLHFYSAGALTANRCYLLGGVPGNIFDLGAAGGGAPSVGGDIDGVYTTPNGASWAGTGLWAASPGDIIAVEAESAFSVGAILSTAADGRVRTGAGGIGVLRALGSASGAGDVVFAVFTSGR